MRISSLFFLSWFQFALLSWSCLGPVSEGIFFFSWQDKIMHLGGFFWVNWWIFKVQGRSGWGLGLLALHAMSMEVLQIWIVGRYFDFFDLAANLLGLSLAWYWAKPRPQVI